MGLCLVFQKARETATEVEYQFGHSLTKMDRSVLIEKSDPTGPEDDPRDPMAQRVIGLVLSRRTDQVPWPEAGALES